MPKKKKPRYPRAKPAIPMAKPYAPPKKKIPEAQLAPTGNGNAKSKGGVISVILAFLLLVGVSAAVFSMFNNGDDSESPQLVVKNSDKSKGSTTEKPAAEKKTKKDLTKPTTKPIETPKKKNKPKAKKQESDKKKGNNQKKNNDKKKGNDKRTDVGKKKKQEKIKKKQTGDRIGRVLSVVKKGNEQITQAEANGLKIKIIETTTTALLKGKRMLRLAVSRPHYDDIGKTLEKLGKGFKYIELDDFDLKNPNKLSEYDVVFLTCSTSGNSDKEMAKALRAFVEAGGTLYASDVRMDALVHAFPEFVRRNPYHNGVGKQEVNAKIRDDGLKQLFGPTLKLSFKTAGWRPASFNLGKVAVFLDGHYRYDPDSDDKIAAPLLVKFAHGKGTVIFTSFHNEEQNTETEKKLLRYLVFATVTAEIETKLTKTMISGGFSPRRSQRIGISLGTPSATAKYIKEKSGPLRFSLGFRKQGAKLQLQLVSPSGQKILRQGESTFSLEINNAPAGTWAYTITGLSVPFDNFPFTLTIGEANRTSPK